MKTDTSSHAVRCVDVQKHFGEGDARIHVLRGVDFEARRGELTFLRRPQRLRQNHAHLRDHGPARFHRRIGRAVWTRNAQAFLRRTDSFPPEKTSVSSFQQYNLLPALTAAENAAVPLLAAGVKRREAVDRAKSLLVKLGLENRMDTLPSKLSGGQQQRVAMARALVHEPRLIVCDEPTAALDHATGESVMELLAESAVHPERAVIVVTHDNRVFHFADAVAHMDDGRITKFEQRN